LLLDLSPEQVHQRVDPANDLSGQRENPTRFDAENETFHRRVQQGFRVIARAHAARVRVLDASRPAEEIHREIVKLVEPLL
jgi:dTMP kinase